MDVKSQLTEAQFEHVTEAAKGTPKTGRIVYATDSKQAYLGDGSEWMQLFGSRVGDVKQSMLNETQFQQEHGNTWILCDGRNITGSDFHTLTSIASAPDMRGRFARGKDNGAGNNPAGDLALGSVQEDQLQGFNIRARYSAGGASSGGILSSDGGVGSVDLFQGSPKYVSDGVNGTPRIGNETRPKNVSLNFFIKINR
jgi:hypothetical protein